jgi:hypothetical protein
LVSVAVWVLTIAVAVGSVLGLWHLRAADGGSRPPVVAGISHGIVGTVGLGALLLALRGPMRGVATGVSSFGTVAAVLFAAAALTGVVLLSWRRNGVVMAIHAGIAITGYAIVLAWAWLG